jgi:hypothetical protein
MSLVEVGQKVEDTSPLADIVSAERGTVGAQVLDRIDELRRKDNETSLRYVWYPDTTFSRKTGIFLKETSGRSFSLKYKNMGEYLEIEVGKNLPSHRILHVAQSIIAMIRRGRSWTDKTGAVYNEGYGAQSTGRRSRSRRRRHELWRERRRQSLAW